MNAIVPRAIASLRGRTHCHIRFIELVNSAWLLTLPLRALIHKWSRPGRRDRQNFLVK